MEAGRYPGAVRMLRAGGGALAALLATVVVS
jgi:hypothetical protein